MEITSKIRVNKTTGQKIANIPKQKETESWKDKDIVIIRKVELK
jgi:hypothetical protein